MHTSKRGFRSRLVIDKLKIEKVKAIRTVGVSCALRWLKRDGSCPLSATPCTCIESAVISEKNWANSDIPALTTIQLPSQAPPISVPAITTQHLASVFIIFVHGCFFKQNFSPAIANAPAFQSSCSRSVAPVATRIGSKYPDETRKNVPPIPFRRVVFVTTLE